MQSSCISKCLHRLLQSCCGCRTDRVNRTVTGCLCGLGWDPVNCGPAFPDHDMEVTFDTEFGEEDLTKVG